MEYFGCDLWFRQWHGNAERRIASTYVPIARFNGTISILLLDQERQNLESGQTRLDTHASAPRAKRFAIAIPATIVVPLFSFSINVIATCFRLLAIPAQMICNQAYVFVACTPAIIAYYSAFFLKRLTTMQDHNMVLVYYIGATDGGKPCIQANG